MGWFWDTLSTFGANNPLLVIIGGIFILFGALIVVNGLFQQSDNFRNNSVFSDINSIIIGVGFVYLVLKFVGEKVNILGRDIEVGLILYIFVALFILLILGG
jgi:hypothetical protein